MIDIPIPYIDGWLAHKGGVEYSNRNPYSATHAPASHALWREGWCDRFSAIKHESDLSFDQEFEEFIHQSFKGITINL